MFTFQDDKQESIDSPPGTEAEGTFTLSFIVTRVLLRQWAFIAYYTQRVRILCRTTIHFCSL